MNRTDFISLNSTLTYNVHTPIPQVLLFHFAQDDRTRMIQRYLRKSHISIRQVLPGEFLHPLGYLFEIPGFSPCPEFNLGGNISQEMLVMKDFSSSQMDAFLQFFHQNNLEAVKLKAVLTPVTAHWNSLALYKELKKEHQAVK